MLEVYGRPGGAVNNHEKPQRSALEENVGTRNPAPRAKKTIDSHDSRRMASRNGPTSRIGPRGPEKEGKGPQ